MITFGDFGIRFGVLTAGPSQVTQGIELHRNFAGSSHPFCLLRRGGAALRAGAVGVGHGLTHLDQVAVETERPGGGGHGSRRVGTDARFLSRDLLLGLQQGSVVQRGGRSRSHTRTWRPGAPAALFQLTLPRDFIFNAIDNLLYAIILHCSGHGTAI